MNKYLLCILFFSFILNGCLSNSGQTLDFKDRYTLIEDVNSFNNKCNLSTNIVLLSILDKDGIVLKTSDVSLRIANNHKWALSLKEQLNLIAKNNLCCIDLGDKYNLDLFVNKFYGSSNGDVYVSFYATLKNKNKVVFNKQYSKVVKQSRDGYEFLVKTLKQSFCEELLLLKTDLYNLTLDK